jgi:hypothetical protein
MIVRRFLYLIKRAIIDPRRALRRTFARLSMPLGLRKFLGAVLPPYTGTSKMKSVYVVTYGRSGSTLLTGYLTKLPGFDLKGENYLFPLPLMEAERRMFEARTKKYGGREQATHPWYGTHQFSLPRFRRDTLNMMLNQLYPSRPIPKTIGFKEIRWYYMIEPDKFDISLDWLRNLRAPGAVIFLFRDLDNVLTSAWWGEMTEEKRAESRVALEAFEARSRAYAASHPESSTVVTYEEFISVPEAGMRVCDVLGVKFDESVWKSVLSENYSYKRDKNKK